MAKIHIMTSVNIPFAGFYGSKWSDIIDQEETQAAEYEEERQDEENTPKERRLEASDFADAFYYTCDYSAAYAAIATDYAAAFAQECDEAFGFKLGLAFEAMTSPREYNFETDRLFCDVPLASVYLLFRLSRKDKHAALAKTIKARFTSCDGFISGYSNRLSEWLEKPLHEWDHNEVGTLLLAAFEFVAFIKDDEVEWRIYYSIAENGYSYFSDCVDWPKWQARIAEKRDEKAADLLAEQLEADPDYVAPPIRCDKTLDLFDGKA